MLFEVYPLKVSLLADGSAPAPHVTTATSLTQPT